MKRAKIVELKEKVNCGALLERAGFAVDVKESTRRAVKYRRGGEIVIVTKGSSARFAADRREAPIDSTIVGIVDTVEIG